jgi:hypothetical protein
MQPPTYQANNKSFYFDWLLLEELEDLMEHATHILFYLVKEQYGQHDKEYPLHQNTILQEHIQQLFLFCLPMKE